MNHSFESGEFGHINLTLSVYINIFLIKFDENKITMQIFSDLNDQFVINKLKRLTYYNI